MVHVPTLAAVAIDVVGTRTLTVERRTGSYVEGAWVDSAVTNVDIDFTSPTPATGRDLQRLDEGQRGGEIWRVIARQQLFSARDAGATNKPDVVQWRGNRYQVEVAQDWDGAFCDALMRRLGD